MCVSAPACVCGLNYLPLLTAARQDAWSERLDEEFYCCSPSFQQPRCNHSLFIPPFSEVDVLEQTCLRAVRGATRCVKKFPPTLGFPDSSYRLRFTPLLKIAGLCLLPWLSCQGSHRQAVESCSGDVLRSQQGSNPQGGSFYGLFL